MKSQKGVTLTSLVIYIVVVLIVLGILAVITANFQGNIKEIYSEGTNNSEIDKFNIYFLKEIKKQGNKIDEDKFLSNEVLFSTGNKYTFNSNEKCIYLNDNIKVAENIERCIFSYNSDKEENEKTVITVIIKSVNGENRTIEYVLSNAKIADNYEDENNYIDDSFKNDSNDSSEVPDIQDTYQNLEYIENNGNQFIDTGVIPNSNTSIDIVYKALNYSTSQYILGARREGNGTIDYAINGSQSRSDWDIRFNGVATYTNSEALRNDHKYQSTVLMRNGGATWTLTDLDESITKTIEINNITVNAITNLYLFGYNSSNVHSNLRIYSCKIYDGQNLIRDFIPCCRESDNTVGMYDLINDIFYSSKSRNNFIAGPEI